MKRAWWKESVVYQIYPRSFHDSNGDGIGDLRGIIQKLDYLQELGVDVVWLSPVYKSPNDDNGYDISDYQAIMAEFGTLADMDELIAGLHERGIKLVMDLVVNHTSDEHAWFQESRQSKESSKRDWYIWRPSKNGRNKPNNWGSFFGGSAWEYDATTDEYYLHLFSKKQPDLNWENPEVRQAIYKMMHWWLQRGVDGFRMDVINLISKVDGLPDASVKGNGRYQLDLALFANGPRLMEFLREMKREVLDHYDTLTVGESVFVNPQQGLTMTHEERGALSMVFHFEHMDIDSQWNPDTGGLLPKEWKLTELKQILSRWQTEMAAGGWNSIYLNNHDQPRAVSRFGDDRHYRIESAKMLATFVHMQQGTPYIYQGEALGMTNVAFESIDDYNDIATVNMYREAIETNGADPQAVLAIVHAKSRDNSRTPMQWDDSPQGGFTSGTPWLKVNPNYIIINAKQALADPHSVFHYYKKLLKLRKAHPVVVYGRYDLILAEHEQIYAFTRTLDEEQLLIILNFTAEQPLFELPNNISFASKELLISNYDVAVAEGVEQVALRPFEARVYKLQNEERNRGSR